MIRCNIPVMASNTAMGSGQAVLYVDDTAMLVEVVSRMLGALKYEPHGFVDACAALKAIREDEKRFALAIVDRLMPVMSGLDLAKQVREIRPDLPIILVTGLHDRQLESSYSEFGIASVLKKPFNRAELAAHVARALGQAGEPPPPEPAA